MFVNVKTPRTISISPTRISALIKKLSGMFSDKPAMSNPIRIILEVCPAPQNAPFSEDITVRFRKYDFFELLVLLFFISCVEMALI